MLCENESESMHVHMQIKIKYAAIVSFLLQEQSICNQKKNRQTNSIYFDGNSAVVLFHLSEV